MTLCARDGCNEPLNQLTLQHGDPYCSCECARIMHGHPMPSYSSGLGYGWTPERRQAEEAKRRVA